MGSMDHRPKSLRYGLKTAVTGIVTIMVIERFEVIHVDHDNGKVLARFLSQIPCRVETVVERPAIG